jgi:hypothetical protein
MIEYPKLFKWTPDYFGNWVWAFEKLDGQNIRLGGSTKRGIYKFGTRWDRISEGDRSLGPYFREFRETFERDLIKSLSKGGKVRHFVLFGELVGEGSFRGIHREGDKLSIRPFDIWIEGSGWVLPEEFIERFGFLDQPPLVWQGKLGGDFIDRVWRGELGVNEGVMAKGVQKGEYFRLKIKTEDWLNRVREFGDLEDL